eukprot:gene6306-7027_t
MPRFLEQRGENAVKCAAALSDCLEEAAPDSKRGSWREYTSLFKKKVFCLWLVIIVILGLETGIANIHQLAAIMSRNIVQVAVERGIPEQKARQFPFYAAISSGIGRILIGLLFDVKRLDKVYAYQCILIVQGVTALVSIYAKTPAEFTAFIFIFSVTDGAQQTGKYPMMRVLVDINKQSEAISVELILSSITILLGSPFVGFIVDETKNYNAFFYVIGMPLLVSCFLLFGMRCLKEFKISQVVKKEQIHKEVLCLCRPCRPVCESSSGSNEDAWVGSIPFAMTFFLAPITQFASRNASIRLSIIIGTAFAGTSLLTTSFATNINIMFLSFSLLYSIGSSLIFMTTYRAIDLYFDKRFATALGIMTGGTCLLQIPLSRVFVSLLENYSLQKTMQIYAGASTAVCLLGSLVYLPTRFEADEKVRTEINKGEEESSIMKYKSLMKSKVFRFWIFVVCIMSFQYSVSSIHQVQFALESGVSESVANQFPFYSAISAGIGRIISGFIFDIRRLDRVYLYQFVIFTVGTIAVVGSFSTTQSHIVAFIWLFAATDGFLHANDMTMIRIIVGAEKSNEAQSLMLMTSSVPVMIGPPIVGLIVDRTNNYKAFFYVVAAPMLLSALLLFTLRCMKEFRLSRDSDKINKELQESCFVEEADEKHALYSIQYETNM